MVQTGSSTGIYLPTAGPHPLSHHLEKIRFSKEEGSFKEKERLLKEMEAKMTYNIIKIAAYRTIIKWPHTIIK
jgi:hypothetical protein